MSIPSSFPMHNKRIVLASGSTIRFYNLIIDISPSAASMQVHYGSDISREDQDGRASEALDVIKHFSESAYREQAKRAIAGICSTPWQAATEELPEQIFEFELTEADSWQLVATISPPRRPPNTR